MENLDPPPPQIKDGKMARFCPSRGFILDLGGMGGLLFHFILSKIVDLSIWSISTNLSYFLCLLWATGLVGFKWNLLHNLFHFDNGMQYIHVLFAVCWNWFWVSK